ncbi:hypothetical protein P0D88_16835 [Paraburkholderia sp. RL18-103-BIB-C]|uniref:hypothetical protein n=1 Tax=Paraburkholderia sp. RL18-103-BIB-C TaxID=3031637 RepID=UPI0038BC8524
MTALYAHIEPSAEPGFVFVRTSTTPDPARKPPMTVRRDELTNVLLMLLDAATLTAREIDLKETN